MPYPPSHAIPLTVMGGPEGNRPPSAILVMREFTRISVIGVVVSDSCDVNRSMTGNLLFGMRYAVFIQKPASGWDSARMLVTCFIQSVAVQPGTTMRAGNPFQSGSGAPFISY